MMTQHVLALSDLLHIFSRRPSLRLLSAVCATLTYLMVAGLAHAESGAKIGAEPIVPAGTTGPALSYFVINTQLAETISAGVRVMNTGTEAGTVRIYPVDATTGQTSGTVFLLRNDSRQGVGSWVTLSESEVTLQPGESREIPFSIKVPAETRGGQHVGAIVVEDTEIQGIGNGGQGAAQVKVQKRLALGLQMNLPGDPVERLTASQVRPGGDDGYQTLLVRIANEGTVMLRPSGSLTVVNAQGESVQQLPMKLDTVLPATSIDFPVFIEGQALGPGEYRANLQLNYGSDKQLLFSDTFSMTPKQVAQVFEGRQPLAPPPVQSVPTMPVPTLGVSPYWWALAGIITVLIIAAAGHPGLRRLAALLLLARRNRANRWAAVRAGVERAVTATQTGAGMGTRTYDLELESDVAAPTVPIAAADRAPIPLHAAAPRTAPQLALKPPTLTMGEMCELGKAERLALYQLLVSGTLSEKLAREVLAGHRSGLTARQAADAPSAPLQFDELGRLGQKERLAVFQLIGAGVMSERQVRRMLRVYAAREQAARGTARVPGFAAEQGRTQAATDSGAESLVS
jgi:hypothetical protein